MVAAVAAWVGGPPGEAKRETRRERGRQAGRQEGVQEVGPTGAVTSLSVFG